MDGLLPIRYAVSGGTAQVDLTVEIAEDGSLAVEVLTESSLPQHHPVRLGRFAGHLAPTSVKAIADWARTLDRSAAGDAQQLAYGSVTRTVATGNTSSISVDDMPPGLEEMLADTARASLANPLAAVEVQASEGQLVIAGIGGEAYPVLLFARDIPGYWVRVWRNVDGAPDGRVFLPHDEVQRLVETGKLPEGPAALRSGDVLSVPLPASDERQATDSGGFMFWRTGQGPERRLLVGTW